MQSQGVTTARPDAMRNVPGVTIGSAEGGTIGTNINLNGFSARTDIYLDGMRDRGQYYRDVFALEQIEVLMGPSSMLFGRGSTGGVINQVTKKPGPQARRPSSASRRRPTVSCARRPTSTCRSARTAPTRPASPAMFQAGKASTIDLTNVLDFGLAPSVKLGIGTPTEITLSAILQHRKDHGALWRAEPERLPAQRAAQHRLWLSATTIPNRTSSQLNSTVDHKFDNNLSLRNQTEFVWVNTAVSARPRAASSARWRERRLRAGGRRSEQHAVQRRAPEPALRSPAEPRSKHQRLHAREPDRADGQVPTRPPSAIRC